MSTDLLLQPVTTNVDFFIYFGDLNNLNSVNSVEAN